MLGIKIIMAKKKVIIVVVILLLILSAGFYFKSDILKIYNNLNKGFADFQKSDIGNLISKAGKEVFSPPPLFVNNKAGNAVLTKAKIIEETNSQRYLEGENLFPLFENKKLTESALAKANDMFLNQYFEHVSPSGVGPSDLVKSFGYDYIVTGENLILGNFANEKELVQAWMDSPGHRANILNNRYSEIGVAIVKGTYEGDSVWIGVQEFGLPLSNCSEPSITLQNQIEQNKIQLDNLASQIAQKKAELNNTNSHSKEYNNLVDEYNQLVQIYQPLAEESKTLILQYNNQVNVFNNCVAGIK